MAKVNMNSIMSKVDKHINSSKFKENVKQVTMERAVFMAEEFIRIFKETAKSKNLPDSVLKHFNSLTYSKPKKVLTGGKTNIYVIYISFEDDLSRPSLEIAFGSRKGERTGEGIDDIVSLFNTGYSAEETVYGIWDNHSLYDGDTVSSMQFRKGLYFVEEAIQSFNKLYSDKYHIKATKVKK